MKSLRTISEPLANHQSANFGWGAKNWGGTLKNVHVFTCSPQNPYRPTPFKILHPRLSVPSLAFSTLHQVLDILADG